MDIDKKQLVTEEIKNLRNAVKQVEYQKVQADQAAEAAEMSIARLKTLVEVMEDFARTNDIEVPAEENDEELSYGLEDQ